MVALGDLLNSPKEITYKGQSYFIKQPDQDQQAQYAAWLEKRARDAAGRAIDQTDEVRDKLLLGIANAAAAGVYEWGGELCCAALRSPSGFAKLIEILLAEQAVTYSMAVDIVNEQLKELTVALLQKADSDPKAFQAVREALGLPSDGFSSLSVIPRSAGRKRSRRSGK